MWNDPGSPWHAQTGGPLLCAYRFLYRAERDRERMDIMWEEEKCFAGQLSKKCPIHYFPFRAGTARRAASRHVTVLGPADSLTLAGGRPAVSWTMAGRRRSLWALCMCVCVHVCEEEGVGCVLLELYIQLKPGPDFSLETCTFERQEGQTPTLHSLCYIHSEHFPYNQLLCWIWLVIKRTEASYRYSTLYKKKHVCDKVHMLNVFYDSCACIFRHSTLIAYLGKHKDYDCRGGGAQMNEWDQIQSPAKQKVYSFSAAYSNWTEQQPICCKSFSQ